MRRSPRRCPRLGPRPPRPQATPGPRRCAHRPLRRRGATAQRGFTYVVLLFMLVLAGIGLASLGQHWQQQARREREAELLFRGQQFQQALARYAAATPAGQTPRPQSLTPLLSDKRGGIELHHLRQLYADPVTGQADWVLLRDAAGGIVGLHSSSQLPALRRSGLPAGLVAAQLRQPRLADWRFVAAGTAPAPEPASDNDNTQPRGNPPP